MAYRGTTLAEELPRVFDCAGSELLGITHAVAGSRVGVVFVAGGGQYRVGSHRLYLQLARALTATGVAVFRFDQRGVGDSDGEFGGFEYLREDIRAAVAAFRSDCPELERIIILGLCDGAAAALISLPILSNISGLVLINPWVHSSGLEARTRFTSYYLGRLRGREFWMKALRGRLSVMSSARSFLGYLWDLVKSSAAGAVNGKSPGYVERMLDGVQKYQGRVLVVQSGQDLVAQQFQQLVTRDLRWKEALEREAVSIANFTGADHTFSTREHRADLERGLVDWVATLRAVGQA